jgi:hypothetical protein
VRGRHVTATPDVPGYDGPVTEPTPTPTEPPTSGERRLARPPSDRYRAAEVAAAAAVDAPDPAASVPRGIAVAAAIALAGAVVVVLLGGVVAFSAGLVVVAATSGWAVAQGLRVGAREHLAPGLRRRLALVLALVGTVLGLAGLWLYARAEGGVLPPIEYLWEVYGVLVPLQLIAAALVAWISAR